MAKITPMMKGSMYLFVSILFIKGLSLIYTPILARILGPEKLGILNLVLVTVTWAITLGLFGGEPIIARFVAEYDRKGYNVKAFVQKALLLALASGIVLSLLHVVLAQSISQYLHKNIELTTIVRLGSLIILPSVVFGLLFNVVRGYRRIAKYSMLLLIRQLTNIGFVLTIIFFISASVQGVLVGMFLSLVLSLTFAYIYMRKYLKKGKKTIKILPLLKSSAYTFTLTLILVLVTQTDKIFLNRFLSAEFVGYYAAALSLIAALELIPTAFSTWIVPFVGEAKGKKDLKLAATYFNKTLFYTILVAGLATFPVILFASLIINILFGAQYLQAIPVLKVLAFAAFFRTITTVFNRYLAGINKTYLYPKLNIISIPLLFLYPFMIKKFGLVGAAGAVIILNVVLLSVYTIVLNKITKIDKTIFAVGVITVLFFGLAFIMSFTTFLMKIILGGTTGAVYAAIFAFCYLKKYKQIS